MPTKPYCGYNRHAPNGRHLGSLEECIKTHQLRRFGRIKAKKRKTKVLSKKDVQQIKVAVYNLSDKEAEKILQELNEQYQIIRKKEQRERAEKAYQRDKKLGIIKRISISEILNDSETRYPNY